jgi:hypothetical protein
MLDMQAAYKEFGGWPEIINACNLYLQWHQTDNELD